MRLLAPCLGGVIAVVLLTGCGDGYSRAEVRYNLARDLAADGDYDAAVQELTEAIRHDPGFVAAHYERGLARLALGDYASAGEDLTAAIALDPGLTEAYRYRITSDMNTGNLDRAFSDSYLFAALRAGPAVVAY